MIPLASRFRPEAMLAIVLALSVSGLVYIEIATLGAVWGATALNVSLLIAAVTFLLGIVLACFSKSWMLGVIVFGLNLAGFFLSALGGLICFGSDRIDNCGGDGFYFLSWLNTLLMLWMCEKIRAPMLLALPCGALFVFGLSYAYWAVPLRQEIKMTDLENVCLFGTDTYDLQLARAERIRHLQDFEMTWIVGEHSPRLYRYIDGKLSKWIVSERGYGRERQPKTPPGVCVG